MPWTTELCHPTPATEEDGYRNLAFAVLTSLFSDLQGPNAGRRQQARASVRAGVPALWLDLMGLSDAARARVELLLAELVAG
jgi:hypothetical protein